MTETPALKPCPFCGAATAEIRSSPFREGKMAYQCVCMECFSVSQLAHTAAEAIAAWNKRSVGSSAPLSAWLPIESAPKDGTKILAFVRGKGWDVMRYHIPANPDARQFWIGSYLIQPTHWMPLPSAPVGSAPKPDEGGSIATNPSLSALKGGGRDGVIEECAKVADIAAIAALDCELAEVDHEARDRHVLRGKVSNKIAEQIRSLKSPPGVRRGE